MRRSRSSACFQRPCCEEDLLRYGNHALTYRAVDRVFAEAPRRFVSGAKGKMGYEDFVWFILSEEDKSKPLALEYWFRCVDLAGPRTYQHVLKRYIV